MCSLQNPPLSPLRALMHAGLRRGHHHLCCLPLVSWQTRLHEHPSPDLGVRPGGWRRRRVAVVRWGMLPGVSESHSITLSSWALLRRATGTSRSHLGRSGAWQGAAGRLQLLFKPWQQSSISVSQQEMQGPRQSRTLQRRAHNTELLLHTPDVRLFLYSLKCVWGGSAKDSEIEILQLIETYWSYTVQWRKLQQKYQL